MTTTQCDSCKNPHDPNTQPYRWCVTCEKKLYVRTVIGLMNVSLEKENIFGLLQILNGYVI